MAQLDTAGNSEGNTKLSEDLTEVFLGEKLSIKQSRNDREAVLLVNNKTGDAWKLDAIDIMDIVNWAEANIRLTPEFK